MSDATPQQIAMADRICREHQPRLAHEAALLAIIETQRLDAELVKWSCMVPPDGGSPTEEEREAVDSIAAAIMAGGHYR